MAYMVISYIAMACVAMACIVMAYTVMAASTSALKSVRDLKAASCTFSNGYGVYVVMLLSFGIHVATA